ncbi:hypothetical protein M7I_0666 [Glarea lozoyensis 74030]|uniref:Uncharacterized protein n=1 Tax=Glarea lozoyensis (strain ATCC 74030 / MF5533) TaxID=1104152 RepID=H0EDZ8_GLAL7|nr:hypothetical protein M7I_0666 [Glarea lozoyensis 74030]
MDWVVPEILFEFLEVITGATRPCGDCAPIWMWYADVWVDNVSGRLRRSRSGSLVRIQSASVSMNLVASPSKYPTAFSASKLEMTDSGK